MVKLVVSNTPEQLQEYHIGNQQVRVTCDRCMAKKIAFIKEIDGPEYVCEHCRKKERQP